MAETINGLYEDLRGTYATLLARLASARPRSPASWVGARRPLTTL